MHRANKGDHSIAELAYRGATELDTRRCDDALLSAVEAWLARPERDAPCVEALHVDGCHCFSITADGKSGDYWPCEDDNLLEETIIRDLLFLSGTCTISDLTVRLYRARYALMATEADTHLLVCPYGTASAKIAGVVVLCVDQRLKDDGSLDGSSGASS